MNSIKYMHYVFWLLNEPPYFIPYRIVESRI